jgi:hypothetical protein
MLRFFLLIFISTTAFAERSLTCSSPEVQTIAYWENLTSSQIDSYINKAQLEGIDLDVFKNQMVSLSYLELFRTGPINSGSRLMGYVYANASHHLGRLVRFHYWENFPNEPLSIRDRSLITGDLLGTTVRTFPLTLSRRLMAHSLALYKTLSWSLTAESKCGQKFVQNLLAHGGPATFRGLHTSKQPEVFTLLREAFMATNLTAFMRKFVAFEQTYLQHTMYSMPDIRVPTSLGMLDRMRFIPFNGEKQLSFFEWCGNSKCGSTSLDLKRRISFDQTVITNELPILSPKRLKKTEILDVARFIFAGYCREGRISRHLCP